MSNGNIIVSKTVNQVEWLVDESSFKRALKRIKSLKTEHEKPAKALEKAQRRTAQSEGKAALAAAKAQAQRLSLAQKPPSSNRKLLSHRRGSTNKSRPTLKRWLLLTLVVQSSKSIRPINWRNRMTALPVLARRSERRHGQDR